MSNELKFGNKVVFLNGIPFTLPLAASDPGSAVNGDMYYNTAANQIKVYQNGAWTFLSSGASISTGSAGQLVLYPAGGSSVSSDFVQNGQNINIDIAAQPTRSTGLIYTLPNPGDSIAAANIVLDAGPTNFTGIKTFSNTVVLSNLTASLPLQLDASKNIISAAIAYSGLNLSGSIVNADIATGASIAESKLNLSFSTSTLNSNIGTVAGDLATHISNHSNPHAVTKAQILTGNLIVNADVDAAAAIAYSKLALTGSIVNADLASGASIAYNKLNLGLSILNADIATSAAIAYSKLALSASIVNTDIAAAAAIDYSKLALTSSIVNADIATGAAIAYSKLAISNSIVNADIATSAAIAYSKLALSASIVNADIATGAAIAFSKMAALTANRALISDGSGVVSTSSATNTELGYLSGVTSAIQTQLSGMVKADGTVAMTGDLSFGGTHKITNLLNPVNPQDAATKDYVDTAVIGLHVNTPVAAATIAPLSVTPAGTGVGKTLTFTVNNTQVIDTITLTLGMRILVKNQGSQLDNGIYTVTDAGSPSTPVILTRATDFDGTPSFEVVPGDYVMVAASLTSSLSNTGWVVENLGVDPIALDVNPIAWTQFSGPGAFTAGSGITQTGNQFSITTDNSLVSSSSNPNLIVKLDGARAITLVTAGIGVNVDNSTIDISGNAIRVKPLGIADAQIATAAAIAFSKMAALTANRVLESNGSGVVSASSVTNTELGYLSGVTSSVQTQLGGFATKALDNLASVAINTSLLPATDDVIELGSNTKEWLTAWVSNLKHDDAITPNLLIATMSNNGSIVMSAHGTGNLDIKTTKVRRSESGASSNFMEDQYLDNLALSSGVSSPAEISASLSFAVANFDSAVINYKIKEAGSSKVRVGQFIVTCDGTITSSSDQFSETATVGSALGLILTADLSGGNVRILYNNTHASNACVMRCNIRRFRV